MVDFPEAARIAASYLRVGDTRDEYLTDHVLVDKGKDLGPACWQLLRALVGKHADDLFSPRTPTSQSTRSGSCCPGSGSVSLAAPSG